MLKARSIRLPTAGKKDPGKEHHARAKNRNLFQRLFEHDEEMTVLTGSVSGPPEKDPVRVYLLPLALASCSSIQSRDAYLMVGDQH